MHSETTKQHTAMKQPSVLATRRVRGNANHHLWNNHGTWWCHFTLHQPDFTKRRLRVTLGTSDLIEAREIRDFLFAVLPSAAPTASVCPALANG